MTRRTSLATRSFLFSFVPVCLVLAISFAALTAIAKQRVKVSLRESLQKSEEVVARARAEASNRASQFVVVLTENAGLKAAIGLLHEPLATPENTAEIRRTIEAQLREIHTWVGYDLLAITDWMGRPVAAVEFGNDDTRGINSIPDIPQQSSLAIIGGALYEMTQIPISLGGEQFATLTLGARFDLNR